MALYQWVIHVENSEEKVHRLARGQEEVAAPAALARRHLRRVAHNRRRTFGPARILG
jgi:hypothetical protein